jgi:IclR family pca regulon transcriptional regulator
MTTESLSAGGADYVQSLARGLAVITAFSAEAPSMTLTEVAEKIGLTRATARRFLLTLENLGYVSSHGKAFSLTPKVMELGYSYLSSQGVSGIVAPHLAKLASQVHESASAAILDGGDIVYIARSAGRKIMQVQITLGTRFPAYATSMGRVLLADLEPTESAKILAQSSPQALTANTITDAGKLAAELTRVRTQGYAIVDQELELGLRSLAVPVRDRSGRVVAAINVSTTASSPLNETLAALLEPLHKCAQMIQSALALTV